MILPIGSVEGHGAHLPILTDTLIASLVSEELAERNGWISLPPVTYTIAVPARIGNVGISNETFGSYLREIIEHFIEFGQKRFILILGHGGPDMKETIREEGTKLCENREISIFAFHVMRVLEDLKLVDQREDRHAGEWETSVMLSAYGELVGDVGIYRNSEDIKKYSVYGDPRKASKARGNDYLDKLLDRLEDQTKGMERSGFSCNW